MKHIFIFFILVCTLSVAKVNAQFENSISEVIGTGKTAAEAFNFNLGKRQRILTAAEKQTWKEKLKLQLANVNVNNYEFNEGKNVCKLREALMPILKLYGREDYIEIVYYESAIPSVNIYAEHILIITSAAKELFNPELLRAAVAHELAHEVFSAELFNAIQKKDEATEQAVEIKCDFMGALALLAINENPLNIPKAIRKIEQAEIEAAKKFNLKQNTGTHTNATTREKFLKLFLEQIK